MEFLMEFPQLVLLLTLILGRETSGGNVGGAAGDVSAAVRADPGRDRSERRVPAHRTLPRASEREQLTAGLLLGVVTAGRTR
jgi:hypothetical protein